MWRYDTLERNQMYTKQRTAIFTVAWMTAMGLLVRSWGLSQYWLSPDEAMILMISDHETFAAIWRDAFFQAHPPLFYFLLRCMTSISRDIYYLKCSSLLPGAALIVIYYFLGKKVSGHASGIAMSFVAAFAYGPMLLSQTIRPYSLMLLFLSLAIWAEVSYTDDGRKRTLLAYALCAAAALLFNYSALIALSAMGAGWALWLLRTRAGSREYLRAVAAHVPAVIAAAWSYWVHLSHASGSYENWKSDYLSPGFLESAWQLGHNFLTVFYLLFYRPAAMIFAALFLAGLYCLWKRGRIEAAFLTVTAFLLTMTMSMTGLYPFIGSRHCVFISPFAALAVGACLQAFHDMFAARLPETIKPRPWFPIIMALISILVVLHYWGHDFLRTSGPVGEMEFPLPRSSYQGFLEYLDENTGPRDVILTSKMTADYLRFETESRGQAIGNGLEAVEYHGKNFYFPDSIWGFKTGEEIISAASEIRNSVGLDESMSVWIVNLGYGNDLLERAVGQALGPDARGVTKAEEKGAIIFKAPAIAVIESIP